MLVGPFLRGPQQVRATWSQKGPQQQQQLQQQQRQQLHQQQRH